MRYELDLFHEMKHQAHARGMKWNDYLSETLARGIRRLRALKRDDPVRYGEVVAKMGVIERLGDDEAMVSKVRMTQLQWVVLRRVKQDIGARWPGYLRWLLRHGMQAVSEVDDQAAAATDGTRPSTA